jgi:protein involved in polysaccharide export with SLBB domain
MHECSSQYVILVEKSATYPDGIHTVMTLPYPITSAVTVGTTLTRMQIHASATDRRPLNFAIDRVTIKRPTGPGGRERKELAVVGDLLTEQPTADTNFPLLPGDLIEIDSTGSAATARRSAPGTMPTPAAAAASELQPHDVITVQVDYRSRNTSEGLAAVGKNIEQLHFQMACEITEIRPNGNLALEGHQTIRNDGKEQRMSLTGEVHPKAIGPDRTVSSRSILNLTIGGLAPPARFGISSARLDASAQSPPAPAASLSTSDAETQAILDELEAAQKAGDYHREAQAYFKLPYIIEPPDILEISITGEITGGEPGTESLALREVKFDAQQCLVAMDGRVNLGDYGSVHVAGMTIDQTRQAIEAKLAKQVKDPRVSVDLIANNSKVYFIITKNAGLGDDVVRAPVTGNETVLDAIASLGGMHTSPQTKMWIARPAAGGEGRERILDINWSDISSGASTSTNYQLLPGDRLFIDEPHYYDPRHTTPPAPVQPPEAVVELPAESAHPAPIPGSGTPAPLADKVAYRFGFLVDSSGDLAEFVKSDDLPNGSVHTSATLGSALRVLRKHNLVEPMVGPEIIVQKGKPAEYNLATKVPGEDRLFRNVRHVKITGREAPQLTASGSQDEHPALNVEIEAHADCEGERCTLAAAFQISDGQSAIVRFKAKDGSPSSLYLVVAPVWLE